MEMAQFHLPSNLDLTDGNLTDSFGKCKRQLEVFVEASGANNKQCSFYIGLEHKFSKSMIISTLKPMMTNMTQQRSSKSLKSTVTSNKIKSSKVFLWNIPFHEPFDVSLTELYSCAASGNFKEKEQMIRDKIVFSVSSNLQELLLHESNLDLKKATDICRTCEITSWGKKETSPPREGYPIDKIEAQHQKKQNNAVKPEQKDGPPVLKECKFCGQSHEAAKTQCPVWGKTCNYCKGKHHFEVRCKKVNLLNVGRDWWMWWKVVSCGRGWS